MRRLWLGLPWLLWTGLAHAEPTESEKALARTLFTDGRALIQSEQWAEACPKLIESQRLDPGAGTLFNIGTCQEHLGNYASAWAAYSEVADLSKQAGQKGRYVIAQNAVKKVEPLVAHAHFTKLESLPSGAEVLLDGKTLGAAALSVDVPLDPGEHRIAVKSGEKSAETPFHIDHGTTDVELPMPVAGAPPPPPPPPPPRSDWHHPVAIGVGAAGIVALGVSIFLGVHAKSQWSDVEGQCPANHCASAAAYSGWRDARTTATAGNVVFVAGLVLAAASVVVWLTTPPTPESR